MARLTVLPDTETDAVDQSTADRTRPEPHASTPSTIDTTQLPCPNVKLEDDTNEPTISPRSSRHEDVSTKPDSSSHLTQRENGTIQPNHSPEEHSPPTPEPPTSETTETTTYIARTDPDLIAALKLISDSVAQQRQLAATALLTHPAYWATLALTLPYFYVEWYHDSSDWPLIIVIWVGVFMAALAIIKWVVRGYLDAAERVGRWSWLYGDQWIRNRFGRSVSLNLRSQGRGQGEQAPRVMKAGGHRGADFKTDYVFVTKLNEKIIATLVVRMENTWILSTHANTYPKPTHPLKPPKPDAKSSHLQKKAIIRAWTVEQQLRGHGIGIALIRFVVCWCLDNGIEGPEFSESHAHSLRLLPDFLNKRMDAMDRRAREMLYWEIQHYVSARGLQVELKGEAAVVDGDGSCVKKGISAAEGEDGMGVGDWFGPGSGPRTIISPRKRVQMSRAITRQILKGE